MTKLESQGALFELENKLSAMGTSLCLETLVDGDPGAFPEFLPSCLQALSLR